ncbi:MAG: efflux RND transporter periplasmic adaptor subunit [Prochlorococcaceae cyanobacterium]
MRLTRPAALQRRPWLLLVAGGAALLLVAASQRVGPWAPPTLLVASPQRLQLRLALVGLGRVEARRSHQLSSVVAARLVSLSADTGDRVRAGQQLGQLDPVDLPERLQAARAALQASRQQTSAAQASVDEAQASLTYVRSNTARFERLALQGAVSEDALLERRQAQAKAEATVASNQAQHAAARQAERQAAAALAGVQAQQQTLRLVAPAAGIVTRRLVDPGSTVVPGQPVLEIADPAQFWIDVRFDQRQATGLATGQPATVEFRRLQGRRLAGVIERIEPTADSLTEELRAKVRLQPEVLTAAGLAPSLGELVEVRVALPVGRDGLAIPAQSLRRRGADLGVWLAGRNGLVFVPLQLGRQDGQGRVEVLAGLDPGAKVLLQPPSDPGALRRYRLKEAQP